MKYKHTADKTVDTTSELQTTQSNYDLNVKKRRGKIATDLQITLLSAEYSLLQEARNADPRLWTV